jgi:hypothetical protein
LRVTRAARFSLQRHKRAAGAIGYGSPRRGTSFGAEPGWQATKETTVALLLIGLLIVLILFGLGAFVVHLLIWVAVIVAIIWVIGVFASRRR